MLCIVSAIDVEVSPLLKLLDANKADSSEIWVDSTNNILITSVGVGYLDAAINLKEILLKYPQIDRVIFCGSAGVYPGNQKIKVGDLCSCADTVLSDGAAEMKLSRYASIMNRQPITAQLLTNSVLPKTRVATTISLTLSDEMAEKIATASHADLENMELYGIASVCQKASISWNGLLGITNTVGSNGHLEWKQNYHKIAEKCSQFLYEMIKKCYTS